MIGTLFVLLATFLEETASSIGKSEMGKKTESIYASGFLMMLWGTVFFIVIAFVRDSFIFSLASLPTLTIRIVLEVLQAHFTMIALSRADRSTFGFLRVITIPLLLATDMFLGYALGLNEIAGVGLIVGALVFLFINHGVKKDGALIIVLTSINAVATISLFKYNITHFNSVEVEQGIVHLVLLAYFFLMATFVTKEKPLTLLKKPIFMMQSMAAGLGTVLISFAFLFAAASVITTVKRAGSVMWSLASGNVYFKEKKFFLKFISLLLVVGGLIFLVL